MVTILKEYIHAERVGDWNEHLASVEKMLHSFCTTHKVHDISSYVFKRHASYGKDTPRRILKFIKGSTSFKRQIQWSSNG